jgi:hypothetical protein
MKTMFLFVGLILALGLGACAHHEEAQTSTYQQSTTTRGYSK